jgi:hypothetical protein
MKAAGRRIKGKRLELKWAELIRESGLDKSARRRPLSGASKLVKGHADIISKLPYSFECKNQEGLMQFWHWWEQAESQGSWNRPPVVVFTSNFYPIMVAMKGEDFLNILKELYDWKKSYQEKS